MNFNKGIVMRHLFMNCTIGSSTFALNTESLMQERGWTYEYCIQYINAVWRVYQNGGWIVTMEMR